MALSSYLREFRALGTAGGLYHFRDSILRGKPEQIFILNADICSSFPLAEMQAFHSKVSDGADHVLLPSPRAARPLG